MLSSARDFASFFVSGVVTLEDMFLLGSGIYSNAPILKN
jgi:hypothetical protein